MAGKHALSAQRWVLSRVGMATEATAYDVIVIGGGVNGAGIARDAAGRGFRVLLCDKGDLAGATSSVSSKLVHGGLRYLEQYEFRLVREALLERETLLRIAPHIVRPMRFVLPHNHLLRPVWMLRFGLFLYDHLASRAKLKGSNALDLRHDQTGAPLKSELKRGFSYSDCWVDDARLVVLNARDAADRGADVMPRWACASAIPESDGWRVTLDGPDGARREVSGRAVVNAAGPWVSDVLHKVIGRDGVEKLRLVQGSHIVVPRLYDGEHAYILQNDDSRVVFVIPYESQFSLIGTTDLPYEGSLDDVHISGAEIDYLCAAVSRYFEMPVRPEHVVWSYSGVRPLFDDAAANPSTVTRDYVLDLSGGQGDGPPLLSVFGGKITTYRRLAEHALEKLCPLLGGTVGEWTGHAALPGGDFPGGNLAAFLSDFWARHLWMPESLATRYVHSYGTRAEILVGDARDEADLGLDFGGGLFEREVAYLADHEWASEPEDILWRRTKLGLHLEPEAVTATAAKLRDWFAHRAV